VVDNMWIIKRNDGQYYAGVAIDIHEYPIVYTTDQKQAKPFNEEEKGNAILFSNEAWEEYDI
jgi:hypothetical protein